MEKQLKEIEIPFGAKDSELYGWEYTIPEGMEATIIDNKIVVQKKESEDERIRESLLEYLHTLPNHYAHSGVCAPEWIAWLEKQKTSDKALQYLKENHSPSEVSDFQAAMNIAVAKAYDKGYNDWLENQGEQKSYGKRQECVDCQFNYAGECKGSCAMKQCEQKPAYTKEYDFHGMKFIPKFAKGDIIKDKKRGEVSTIKDFSYDTGLYTHTYGQFPITIQDNYELIEQKPVDKVEPKFKVGDFIVNDYCMGKVIELTDDAYLLDTGQGIPFSCEHNAHLWTIQDAKDGDVLNSPTHRLIWIYKDNEHYHACVNMNYVTENVATDGLISIPNDACPANKDEQTILFAIMKESNYKWDADKRELKKIEQKPAEWSEEDEKQFVKELQSLMLEWSNSKENMGTCIYRHLDKLISIRSQNTWKPSDEQMHALHDLNLTGNISYVGQGQELINLFNDLKKLKE